MSARLLVLLLRTPADPDPYAAALEEAGFAAVSFPVLRFDFVNGGELARRLARPDRYAGLILTSPRAAEALEQHRRSLKKWAEKPVYVVGPATADAVRDLGLHPKGEGGGDAETLAAHIIDPPSCPATLPLLFLCGDRRRDTLPDALAAAGVSCEELTVYHTHPVPPALPPGLDPAWAVFFSPSGVEAAMGAAGFPWNRLRTGAIGPTTAEMLRRLGRPPAAVAAAPTPDALADALARASG